jgi:hypothetical protein
MLVAVMVVGEREDGTVALLGWVVREFAPKHCFAFASTIPKMAKAGGGAISSPTVGEAGRAAAGGGDDGKGGGCVVLLVWWCVLGLPVSVAPPMPPVMVPPSVTTVVGGGVATVADAAGAGPPSSLCATVGVARIASKRVLLRLLLLLNVRIGAPATKVSAARPPPARGVGYGGTNPPPLKLPPPKYVVEAELVFSAVVGGTADFFLP